MGNTVWTKNAKEGFGNKSSDQPPNNETPANYGNHLLDGDSISEKVLIGTDDITQTTSPTPTPTPTQTESAKIKDKVTDLFNDFDIVKAKGLYNELLSLMEGGLKNYNKVIENIINAIVGKQILTPKTKEEIKTVTSQISRWLIIPLTYILLINWWYLILYSTFTVDFRKFIWTPIKWIVAGPFSALEFLNYWLITLRMDANRIFPSKQISDALWDWRTIIFIVCHIILMDILVNLNISTLITSFMSKTGLGYIILLILSIYYFFNLFVTEKWYDPFIMAGMLVAFLFIVCIIISFVLMFLFIEILCPVFSLYLLFLSNFAIVAFNGFWPPYILSSVNQIFQELKETYPIDSEDNGKIWKVLYNNMHSIYLLFITTGIFLIHMTQIARFKTPAVIGIGIAINLAIVSILAPGSVSVVKDIFNILSKEDKTETPISPPER